MANMKNHLAFFLSALLYYLPLQAAPLPEAAKPVQPEHNFNITEGMEHNRNGSQTEKNPASADSSQTLELSADELLARPELLKQALISSLVLQNIPAIRQLLPIYRRLPDHDQAGENRLLHTLSQALLDRAEGRFGRSADAYRRALAEYPDMPVIRFFLAQNLFADQQNREAEQEFKQLENHSGLPEAARRVIPEYLDGLKQRQRWQFYGNGYYTRERNINNATGKERAIINGGVWLLPKTESAQGIAYRGGGVRDWYLKNGFSLRGGADIDGKFYWDNHEYDDLSIRISTGAVYRNARSEAALLPYFERRWYGTEKYNRDTGVRAEVSHRFNSRHRLLTAAEYGRERYDERHFLNGPRASLSATWLYGFSSNGYMTLGGDWAYKKARDGDDSYRRYGLRGSWSQYWQNGLNTGLSLSYGMRRYQGEDLLNIRRRDREYAAGLTLAHEKLVWRGVRPQLVLQWQKTASNHPLYGHQKANGFIQLNKSF